MPDTPDIERRLTEIRDELRDVKRLLIGDTGDGALDRLTRLEQRHAFLKACYGWLLAGVGWLFYMVVPSYFHESK